jgi:hypothetical protein
MGGKAKSIHYSYYHLPDKKTQLLFVVVPFTVLSHSSVRIGQVHITSTAC